MGSLQDPTGAELYRCMVRVTAVIGVSRLKVSHEVIELGCLNRPGSTLHGVGTLKPVSEGSQQGMTTKLCFVLPFCAPARSYRHTSMGLGGCLPALWPS